MGGCCDKEENDAHEPLAAADTPPPPGSAERMQKIGSSRRKKRRAKADGGSNERWVSREVRDYGSARKRNNCGGHRLHGSGTRPPPRIVGAVEAARDGHQEAGPTIVRRPSPIWAGMLRGSSESSSEFSYSYSEKGSVKLRKESFSTLQFQNLVITRGLKYVALAPLKELRKQTCGFALQTMLQDRLRCVDYRGFGSVLSGDLESEVVDKDDAWLLMDAVKAPASGEREVREWVFLSLFLLLGRRRRSPRTLYTHTSAQSIPPASWLAIHALYFYNEVNIMYGALVASRGCHARCCPTMSAGEGINYLWANGVSVRTPMRVVRVLLFEKAMRRWGDEWAGGRRTRSYLRC